MEKTLIGIIGQKGSGKTTLAKMLVQQQYVVKERAVETGIREIK